jgi:hypothetical protein
MADVTQVFPLALLTALATGLGALPFLFVKNLTPGWRFPTPWRAV